MLVFIFSQTKNRGRNAIKSEDEDDDETEEDEEEEEEDEDKTEEEDNNDCDDVIKEMVQRRKKFLFDEVELMSVKRSAVKFVSMMHTICFHSIIFVII